MRIEWFALTTVQGTVAVPRGEALRAFIAAIAETCKEKLQFTTDDVFARVRTDLCTREELRKMTSHSKLIGTALAKARSQGLCFATQGLSKTDDPIANRRPKRVWQSLTYVTAAPDLTITPY